MKRVLNIILTLVLAAGVVYLFVFANIKQKQVTCKEFIISIEYDGAPTLIKTYNIRNAITAAGIKVKGQSINNLQAKQIIALLNNNPYIAKSTLSVSVNGIVTANILQRKPLVRVIDRDYNQVLIDDQGYIMPISDEFPVRLIIANGYIPNLMLSKLPKSGNDIFVSAFNAPRIKKKIPLPTELNGIYQLAREIQSDTLSAALIEQIYINENKEVELIPKIGDQIILFGDITSLDEKLSKLKTFYHQGMKTLAWNNYKTINLKYKHQVVCSK